MTDYTHYKMLIDGQWVPASDGAKFNSLNPTTGKVWATVPEATAEDVDRAVRAADRAFNQGPWPAMSASERGHCLRRLAMLLAERSDELGAIETTDTGKMLKETRWQAKYISEFFHFFAGCADKIHGETLPIDKPDMFVFTNREPLGCPGTHSCFYRRSKLAQRLPRAIPSSSKLPNLPQQRCWNSAV